ncbi:MAG: hypothetical protein AMJ68_07920 [Acidithiobacillales bacterium SG8_45]|jgi:hypothetical protein|nr:MAG: hypothetical protein AMJ68_07920 [Acidithiobacillales bacterium SG8_45]
MERPSIRTAIPQRRYQYGEYIVSVLGEIESSDPPNYQYILAAVKEGETEPEVYVTCERTRRGDHDYRVRLIMEGLKDTMGESDELGSLDVFCETALQVVASALNLGDAQPLRLG